MKAFAKRLRAARKEAGYDSAERFAHALGVEPHTYRHWERAESQPNLTILTRMCQLLNVTPNELLPLASQAGGRGSSENRSAA